MSKFIPENGLTKENFYNRIAEFKALSERKPTGANEIEKLKQKEEIQQDALVYDHVLTSLFANTGAEPKKQILSILPQDARGRIKNNMLANLRSKVANLPEFDGGGKLHDEYEANCTDFDSLYKFLEETNHLTPEFKELYQEHNFIPRNYIKNNINLVLPIYINSLSKEQLENIEKEINEYKTVFDKEHHYVKRYDAEINAVKDKAINVENLNKVNDILVNPDYTAKELDDLRQSRETALLHSANDMAQEELKSGEFNFDAITTIIPDPTKSYSYTVVNPGKNEEEAEKNKADLEKLKSAELTYSDHTKNSLKEIFNKLEEYGYVSDGIVAEQGTKAYALSKYNDAIIDFKNQLNAVNNGEKDADPKKLDEKAQEVIKHDEQTKDLLETIHKNFPASEYDLYPGNVDVTRNITLPPNLREDVAGVSQLNGIYTVYSFYKSFVSKTEGNPTIDEFLEKPLHYYQKYYHDYILPYKVANKSIAGPDGKGLAGIDAINHLSANKLAGPNTLANARIGEALARLDKENWSKNLAATEIFETVYSKPIDQAEYDRGKIYYTNDYFNLDKFLLVDEPQTDLKLFNHSFYNPETYSFENYGNFDEITYIAEKGQTPEQLADQLDKALLTLLNTSFGAKPDDKIQLCQKAALKFLLVTNPNPDVKLEGVERLESLIKDGSGYVNKLIEQAKEKDPSFFIPVDVLKRITDKNVYKDLYENRNKEFDNLLHENTMSVNSKEFEYDNLTRQYEFSNFSNEEKEAHNQYINQLNIDEDTLKNIEVEGIIAKDANLDSKKAYIHNRDEYCKTKYGEDFDELSDDDKDIIYARYVESAKQEKNTDVARQFMLKEGLTDNSEIHSRVQEFKELSEKNQAQREALRLQEEENTKKAFEEKINFQLNEMNASGVEAKNNLAISGSLLNLINDTKEVASKTFNNYQQQLYKERIEFANQKLDDVIKYTASLLSDDAKNRILESLDKETKDKLINAAKTDLINAAARKITISTLRDEFKKDAQNMSMEEVRLRADHLLNDAQKNNPNFDPLARIDGDAFLNVQREIQKELGNAYQLVGYKLDTFKTYHELEHEKAYTYTNEERINGLKDRINNSPDLEELSAQEKDDYLQKLDAVNNLFISTDDNTYSEAISSRYQNRELAMEKDLASITKKEIEKNKVALRPSGETTFDISIRHKQEVGNYLDENGHKTPLFIVDDKDQKEYQELKQKDVILSGNTKENIKAIFQKLDEFGLSRDGFVGEQGDKIYSTLNYKRRMGEFDKAYNEGRNMDALRKADEILQAKANIDELLKLVHEKFPNIDDKNNPLFPGNVDVSRTRTLPLEWRKDPAMSVLNGLYATINFIRLHDLDVDKFLENPAKTINEFFEKEMMPRFDLDNVLKGKSPIDAVFTMVKDERLGQFVTGGYGRIVESLAKIETDERYLGNNLATASIFSSTTNNLGDAEKSEVFFSIRSNLNRFFLINNEPLQDASITQMPLYDPKKCQLKPAPAYFDEIEYIKNDARTLSEFKADLDKRIIESFQRCQEGIKNKDFDNDNFRPTYIMREALKAAGKYMLVRGELEKNDPAYEELKNLVNDSKNYLKQLVDKAIENKEYTFRESPDKEPSFEDLELQEDLFDIAKQYGTEFDDFVKENEKNIGKDQINKDKEANRELQELANQISKLEKKGDSQELKDLKAQLQEKVNAYKEDVLKSFREGNISEHYLTSRVFDLDNGNFKNVPQMFEPEMTKEQFLKQYEKDLVEKQHYTKADAKQTMSELDDEAKDILYSRHQEQVENKRLFLLQKFMEDKKLVLPKTFTLTDIEKGPINRDLAQEKEEVKKDVKVEDKRNDFEKMLDDEDDLFSSKDDLAKVEVKEQVKEAKVEEKVEVKEEIKAEVKEEVKEEVKPEVKEEIKEESPKLDEVKVEDSSKAVEQITIDLDDDNLDMNLDSFEDDMSKEMKKDTLGK